MYILPQRQRRRLVRPTLPYPHPRAPYFSLKNRIKNKPCFYILFIPFWWPKASQNEVQNREKVSKTLRYLNLEEFAFRRFDQLSGGERQRVIIAKAVAQDPAVYLFDEPTSDLDLKNQIEIMKRIKELISVPESSKSALIAIHDINIAARFSDRILLLHEGRIIANGTPQEVLTTKNIAEVFNVTSEIVNMHPNYIRIIIKDEINLFF